MAGQPSKWLIVGQKVLDEVRDKAPPDVKKAFAALVAGLASGPYPGVNMRRAAAAPGLNQNHLYVAWHENVEVMYLVMQDQPVVSLVGVHWHPSPGVASPSS